MPADRPMPARAQVIFVAVQLLYTIATLLPATLLWESRHAHMLYLLYLAGNCVWNGGSYYIEVRPRARVLARVLAHVRRPSASTDPGIAPDTDTDTDTGTAPGWSTWAHLLACAACCCSAQRIGPSVGPSLSSVGLLPHPSVSTHHPRGSPTRASGCSAGLLEGLPQAVRGRRQEPAAVPDGPADGQSRGRALRGRWRRGRRSRPRRWAGGEAGLRHGAAAVCRALARARPCTNRHPARSSLCGTLRPKEFL